MRKRIWIFFLFFLSVFPVNAEKLAEFGELFKSPAVVMGSEVLCIWDQPLSKIRVYSRKDFKKMADFGKRGQAPGEFIGINSVHIHKNAIYINAFPRLAIYSFDGKLIKEIKSNTNSGSFIPFGNNFVGISYPFVWPSENCIKFLYSLFDAKLEKIKDVSLVIIKKSSIPGKNRNIIYTDSDYTGAVVYGDNLIIGDTTKGFYFSVYDINGNKSYDINREYKKRKNTQDELDEYLENQRKIWGERQWEKFNAFNEYRVRGYHPAYRGFKVNSGKIYAFSTFKLEREKGLAVTILDLKGRLIKNKTFPLPLRAGTKRGFLADGSFYYMLENEDTEQWELHRTRID